jgi:hypothetical protein
MKITVAGWNDPLVKAALAGDRSTFKRVVSISRTEPRWVRPAWKVHEFCPSAYLLAAHKAGLGEAEYRKQFLAEMSPERFRAGLAQVQDGDVLCCWEGRGKFCHRLLVADLLEQEGVEVERR